MLKVVRGVKGIVSLAVIVFVALVVFGVYAALDAVGSSHSGTAEAAAVVSTAKQVKAASISEADLNDGVSLLSDETKSEQESEEPQQQVINAAEGSGYPVATSNVFNSDTASSAGGGNAIWHEPEYSYVEHAAEYTTVHHEAVYSSSTAYFTVCSDCGFKVQSSIYPHQDTTGHGRYSTDVPFTSQTLVRDAWGRVGLREGGLGRMGAG